MSQDARDNAAYKYVKLSQKNTHLKYEIGTGEGAMSVLRVSTYNGITK